MVRLESVCLARLGRSLARLGRSLACLWLVFGLSLVCLVVFCVGFYETIHLHLKLIIKVQLHIMDPCMHTRMDPCMDQCMDPRDLIGHPV